MTFGRVPLVCILTIAGSFPSYAIINNFGALFHETLVKEKEALVKEKEALGECMGSIIRLIKEINTTKSDCVKDFKDLPKNCGSGNFSFTSANKEGTPFILPGTNYCGVYNNSKDGKLGFCKTTDQCCKTHDSCTDRIAPGETKYGITNDGTSTRFNCICEDALRDCLQNGSTLLGQFVGFIYFTLRHEKCFKEDYPLVCKENKTVGCFELCGEYVSDITQNKTVQFVDQKGWDFSPFLKPSQNNTLGILTIMNGNC